MVIKNHIAPEIGDIALCDLTPTILQTWINDKFREKYSEKSMSIFRCVMDGALRNAVYPWSLLNENPMQYVTMPKRQRKKVSKEDLLILVIADPLLLSTLIRTSQKRSKRNPSIVIVDRL